MTPRYSIQTILLMRLSQLILTMTILTLIFFSCKKKDSVTPAPVIAANDSTKIVKTDSVQQASIYPYTETYKGYSRDVIYADYGSPLSLIGSSTDSSFTFYVIHPAAGKIIFKSTKSVWMTGHTAPVYINDTLVKNNADYYLSGIDSTRINPMAATQTGVDTFSISNGLHFNWSYTRTMCTDYEDHFCSFVGQKI